MLRHRGASAAEARASAPQRLPLQHANAVTSNGKPPGAAVMRAKQPEPARAFPEHPPLLTLNWYVAVSTMPSLKRSKKAAGRANGKKTFRKAGVLGHLQQRAEARLKANASQHGKQPRARTLALDWPGHSQPKLHSQADPHLPLRSSRSGSLQGMVGGSAACSAMHAACTAAQT